MGEDLPGVDEPIAIGRAAALAGLAPRTLRQAARDGRLRAVKPGHDWLTTRRWLHAYLTRRAAVPGRIPPSPLPPHYAPPDAKAPDSR